MDPPPYTMPQGQTLQLWSDRRFFSTNSIPKPMECANLNHITNRTPCTLGYIEVIEPPKKQILKVFVGRTLHL